MAEVALFEEDALEEGDALASGEDLLAGSEGYDEGLEEMDDLEAEAADTDALDAFEEFEEAEAEAGAFEDSLGEAWTEEDEADALGDFAYDAGTGLYLPSPHGGLITGPAAVALARRLNPQVLMAMNADDADAFFRRIGRGLRRIGRGIRRVAGRAGRVIGRVARAAAPLLRRALPMIQRVAGLAGPWGRLISAGIGAARGLIEGRGLRGALAGAVGGLIPGVGGRLASSILGGDGADDDAALDALADMADVRQVAPAVALPLGAGLAARAATPRPAGVITPAAARQARRVERTMLRAGTAVGGSTGRRLRVMRTIARVARARVSAAPTPEAAARALPAAASVAARRVVAVARRRPAAGTSSPASARRRLAARRRIIATLPLGAVPSRIGPLMTI